MKLGARQFKTTTLRIAPCALPVPEPERVRWVTQLVTDDSQRGQGNASMLMSIVCREADKHAITLLVEPKPYVGGGLDRNALECFYTRRGFQRIQDEPVLMARWPRQ